MHCFMLCLVQMVTNQPLGLIFFNVNKRLGLSIFDPNSPAFYRVYLHLIIMLTYYVVILL